jgi:hypothetical protein
LSPYPSEPDVTARGEITPPGWLQEVKEEVLQSLDNLARLVQDRSHRVDEYQVQEISASVSQVQTSPDYEIDQIITSIIVTGPANTAFTLNVGRRNWNLTTPATGILVISPIMISLGRSDNRTLTSATPGNWTLELMGHTESKYRWSTT